MAGMIQSVVDRYNVMFYENSDPRTRGFFLIDSPFIVIGLVVFYNYFVLKWGPYLMKDRKPFQIDRLIQVYNIVQVILCLWLCWKAYTECYAPWGRYSWTCEPIDYNFGPHSYIVAKHFWVYYMIKVVDLLDTVFFVLRKKNSQVTFLHVYHHAGMVLATWGAAKYIPGGQAAFIGMINCLVHALMYTYYFITNCKPEYKKNLWWKKHITQLQMFQFCCILIHYGQVLFHPDCEYPKWAVFIVVPQNLVIFYLFIKFYKEAYLTPKPKAAKSKSS